MKIAQNYAESILTCVSQYPILQNVNFFAGRHIFISKMKIKMADCRKQVVKNIGFQIKTLLVMFYRHNKTFWYQFCNFKHFRKAENSEDSLASLCEEFCIIHVAFVYETGLLLELVEEITNTVYNELHCNVWLRSVLTLAQRLCEEHPRLNLLIKNKD